MTEPLAHDHAQIPECVEFERLQVEYAARIRNHPAVKGPHAGTRSAVALLVEHTQTMMRSGHELAATLDVVAEALAELRLVSTRPPAEFDSPNAKDWARNMDLWDQRWPVLAAFLVESSKEGETGG